MRPIKTFYLSEGNNWGDVFTPFLFSKRYNLELEQTIYDQPFDLVSTGSLLRDLPNPYHSDPSFQTRPGFTGHVLGTGLMDWTHPEPFDLTAAKVHLLRGRLTLENCKTFGRPPLGDPGILAYLFAPIWKPEYEIGLIPHYVEKDHRQIKYWMKKGAHLIDVQSGVQNVINEASKCERIISSSLHGLVLADSLGIPNHLVVLHPNWVWGRCGFKFHDYYSVYNERADDPHSIDEAIELCKTRDTTAVKAAVKQAFDNFVESWTTRSENAL